MDICSLAVLYERALVAADTEFSSQENPKEWIGRLPEERILQLLLYEGAFGVQFTDNEQREIRIEDYGDWNRGAGPDFLNARISINGTTFTGDIELDTIPENWEHHGHSTNPNFDKVILHITCAPPKKEWFTQNSQHKNIPFVVIPKKLLLNHSDRLPNLTPIRQCQHSKALKNESIDRILTLLQSAAAYRLQKKHQKYLAQIQYTDSDQCLYENIAETLGYRQNKIAMRHLAMRAPLKSIQVAPEAILFGTSGFLIPILKEDCTLEAIKHHKTLWGQWWPLREQFELAPERNFPWVLSGSRPANHPQRRTGALAVIASDFANFKTLCSPKKIDELTHYLTKLNHPYWSTHCTLPSKQTKSQMALMGKERILDFIINHVLPMDGTNAAWEVYLKLKASKASTKVQAIHNSLFAERPDAAMFLKYAWQHQGLLQIHEDLCKHRQCCVCSLLNQL